jgi:DNA-binding SARP family transcriptional activator/tetratricopeptide (TPR) repeat protein
VLGILLMGAPVVTVDGKQMEVDTRKATAILSYIAVEGTTSRDYLTAMLWSDAPADRARSALRRTLSALRLGTGQEYVVADRAQVALTGPVELDVHEFRAAVGATHDHGHAPGDVCERCVPDLMKATSLYRGDFLQGFSVRDAPQFEDWMRATTEQIRLEMGDAFNRLAHGQAAAGDYAAAIGTVRRWVELDQLHEPAHRLQMLLHAWAGDRPGAISAYRDFVGILDRELGVAPLEETTELFEAILDEDLPPAPGVRRRPRVGPPASAATPAPLQRTAEKEKLLQAWEGTGERGQMVALTGASWMGKTRLLEEMATEVKRREGSVFQVGASRSERSLPYGVAGQLVAPLVARAGESAELPEWVLGELARIDPRIAPSAESSSDRFGQLRLFEAFHELLTLVSRERPVLITVDDMQWSDLPSAHLLSFLSRRMEGVGVLVTLAVNSGEFLEEPVAQLLAGIPSITLDPIGPDQLADRIADPATAEAIVAETGGVPLLVLEAMETGSAPASELTRYLDERLTGVSDLAKQLLAAAAVVSTHADFGLLREVSGRSELEVVEGLEELANAGLLVELPGTMGYGFTLDALSSRIYESTSLARRRLLHRRAGDALSAGPWAGSDPRLAAAIAVHYQGAGSPQAAAWFRRAGDLSRQVYAHAEAIGFYRDAIAVSGDETGELHLVVAEAALAQGDYSTAKRELDLALLRAEGTTLALVEHRLGEVHRLLGRFELASECFSRSLSAHPQPATLLADWALLHHRQGEIAEAREKARQSLEMAPGAGRRVLARSLNVAATVAADPLEAIQALDQALELAGENEVVRMTALNNKAHWLSAMGDHEGAVTLLEEAIDLAARTGHRHREAALRNHLADVHHGAGNDDAARTELEQAVTLFADVAAGTWEPELWLLRHW